MSSDNVNSGRTVYIVQNDSRKDFSDAERFGALRDVFGNVGLKYNTSRMLNHARRVLRNWKPGDYLLVVGDPTLCGVAIAVISEKHPVVDVLRWDRVDYMYVPQSWDFDAAEGFMNEASAPHNVESEN